MAFDWNDTTNPITEDWVTKTKEAEETFERDARERPYDLQEIYEEFHGFLFRENGYFGEKYIEDYFVISQVRHEWGNSVNLPVTFLIDKFEEELSDDILEKIVRQVKMTSQLFEVWVNFGDKGKQSLSDIFQTAIDLAQTNDTHQIVVLGQELLSEIGNIQVGHKTANFTLVSTLLENAKKYSPEGSTITVEVSKEYHQPISSITGKEIGEKYYKYYVSVADEGIGIPIDDQKRVIEEGQRGSNVGNIPGTGFGLYLVYELCNWQVAIESPLYPEAEKYKGTKIKAELYNW
jgi:light-regulated signal transduction histidine kinase (bacteriophytochrome)